MKISCTALYCTVLYCTVLYLTVLFQGHLASIHSSEENIFVTTKMNPEHWKHRQKIWLDGRNMFDSEDSFGWTDGTRFTFKNFCESNVNCFLDSVTLTELHQNYCT